MTSRTGSQIRASKTKRECENVSFISFCFFCFSQTRKFYQNNFCLFLEREVFIMTAFLFSQMGSFLFYRFFCYQNGKVSLWQFLFVSRTRRRFPNGKLNPNGKFIIANQTFSFGKFYWQLSKREGRNFPNGQELPERERTSRLV